MLKRGIAFACALAALTGTMPLIGDAAAQTARTEFKNRRGETIGHADLTQGPNGMLIYLELRDMPPGPHGIHIHSVGTCEDHAEGFPASKGHINPGNKPHGLMNPQGPDSGDLPNIFAAGDGTVRAEMFTTLVSLDGNGPPALLDGDGAAIVIHENRDDHMSQPIGGAGARIACGVISAR